MPDPDKQEIIIVRRYEAEEEQHKGGVWKIAHADFMTAMMAFFLVMWLISVTDNETRSTISNYFNPLKLAESTTDRKGLNDPKNDSHETREGSSKTTANKGSAEEKGGRSPQSPKARFNEGALFQDPYAVLAKLATESEQGQPQDTPGADVPLGESGDPGMSGGEAYRDPFDPLYWQVAPLPKARTKTPGAPGTVAPAPEEGAIDALAVSSKAQTGTRALEKNKPVSVAAAEKATPTNEVLAQQESKEDRAEAEIRTEVEGALKSPKTSSPMPKVDVRRTGEGILISITDDMNFSMFAVGSAEPRPNVVRAMERLAKVISSRPGRIIIRGHTDGRPFKSDTYDNWRLSTARAHMAAYMLIRGGVDEARIERVEGHADRNLKNPSDPNAAENRRIEILMREDRSG
ncbi:MotB family protein [Microvirga thermotolerans]|uniref:MotB family protein n=1 Tax=Microvirga thermotolerans TaxID=2651334 RepID=A0A5P9K597_9HYPH|nr:MotB family protein [Microvirga thermotolerans]QFU17674.1 MotB family protein [Microvirga thermotolerans]